MNSRFVAISPLALLGLAACKSDNSAGGATPVSAGFAIKGPLQNALAFVDENGNREYDAGEASVRTGADGSYSLENPNGVNIVIRTDEQTIDTSSGAVVEGITLVGASDAGVITPFSTLGVDEVDTAALAEALGLEGVDLLEFNPYAEGVDAETALAVEKVSQQLIGTLQVLDAAGGGEGTFEGIVAAVEAALENGEDIDFTDPNFLQAVATEVGVTDAGVLDQVAAVNGVIAQAEGLGSADDPTNEFATAKQVADIYEEGGVDAGNDADVAAIAANDAPTNIEVTSEQDGDLSVDETAENSTDTIVGTLAADDDGAAEELIFEVLGDAADIFEVNVTPDGPVLAVKEGAELDAETASSIDVEIKVTDGLGKEATTTVTVAIANLSEFETTGIDDSFLEGSIEYGGTVRFQSALADEDNGEDPTDFASETYTWFLDGEVVEGETSDHIQTTADMAGKFLSAELTVVDQTGEETTVEDEFGHILPRWWEGDTPIVIQVNEDTASGLEAFSDEIEVVGQDLRVFFDNVGSLFGAFEVALDAADGFYTELEADGELSINFLYEDPNNPGNFDGNGSELEFRFNDLDTNTFADLQALVSEFEDFLSGNIAEVGAADLLANTSLGGALNSILFESTEGKVQLRSRPDDRPDRDDSLDIRIQLYDENGEDIDDPDLIQTFSLRGDFDTGLQTLRDLIEEVDENYEDADAAYDAADALPRPEFNDYVDEQGNFDSEAFNAAWQEIDEAYEAADDVDDIASFASLNALLEDLSPTGLRASYFQDENGERAEAFYADFADTYTDGEGVEQESIYIQFGDYFFFAEGEFPRSLSEIASVFDPAGPTLDDTIDAADEQETGGLATVLNGDGALPGLVDAGFDSLDFLGVFERTDDGNNPLIRIEIEDFAGLVENLDDLDVDDEAFGSYGNVTDDDNDDPYDLSYAYDDDGIYLVLGEGLDFDAFDALLGDLDLGAAVPA